MQADPPFSSSFLEKLNMLVKSIDPDRLPVMLRASKKWCQSEPRVHALLSTSPPVDASFPSSCTDDLKCASMVVPRLPLEVCRSELDEQSEELDREIRELMTSWERWPLMGDEDLSPKTNRISKWQQGHPWDLNDEYIREDPDYDEKREEREALRDYLSQLEEPPASVALEEAGAQNRAASAPACRSPMKVLPERPAAPFGASSKLPCSGAVVLKKPYVRLRRLSITCKEARRASGTGSSSEADEAGVPPRRGPRLKVCCRASAMGGLDRKSRCTEADGSKLELQDQSRRKRSADQKAPGGCQRPVAGHASESLGSSPASSPNGSSPKQYNFRQKTKAIRYDSGGENSWSDRDSEDDWSPVGDGSEAEEEEEEEEAEEEEEEIEPLQNAPLKANLPEGGRSYPCPECGRKFSNSSNMWKHLRIHTGERPFGCHACGKSFSDPSNLSKHQLAHTGERHHLCSLCPKAFYDRKQLEIHLRRHQDIRPFSCLDCDSRFFSRADLLIHMEVHIFGKGAHHSRPLLRCEDCDKSFAGTRLLREHKKRHRRFMCEMCGEVFTLKFKYMFHKSLHNAAPCECCGASGIHLCQSRARDGQHPESSNRDTLAPPSDVAGSARRPTQPSGSPQVLPSSTESPSVPANTTLPSKERSRPSNPTSPEQPEQPSSTTQVLVQPLQPNTPLGLLSSALPDNETAGPSNPTQLSQLPNQVKGRPQDLTQNPVQPRPPTESKNVVLTSHPVAGAGPTPTVGPLVPVVFPHLSPPMIMVIGSQPNPNPTAPITAIPFSQALQGFLISPTAPVIPFPLVALGPELNNSIPLSSPGSAALLGNFSPVNMAPNQDLIVLNPATLLPGTKITLQIPAKKVVPTMTPETCQWCKTKYLGNHNCKLLHQSPVGQGQEKTSQHLPVFPQKPSPELQPPPQTQVKQEPLMKSYDLREDSSHVIYVVEGEESDVGADSHPEREKEEVLIVLSSSEEDDTSAITKSQLVPSRKLREPRQAKQHRSGYRCNICDKQFVHQRSLKQHVRLHLAFSCNQCDASFLRREQLERHMSSHTK